LHFEDDGLRVATLEFLVKVLATKRLRDDPDADLKQDVLSAVERIPLQFVSSEMERAEIRAKMHAEANAILNWAVEGRTTTISPIAGRPLSPSHYRQWR
jgi:deoxycytidylate deaminase